MNIPVIVACLYLLVGVAFLVFVRLAKPSDKHKGSASFINFVGNLTGFLGSWGFAVFLILWPIWLLVSLIEDDDKDKENK